MTEEGGPIREGLEAGGTNVEDDAIPDPVVVNNPDANLRAALESALGKNAGDAITDADLVSLTGYLELTWTEITDLSGLEYCTGLTELHLGGNQISDISTLAELTNLTTLRLGRNQVMHE